jgi:tetratricopeptide (TPR) repeat protein
MSSSAKILRFPVRSDSGCLSPKEAELAARDFLAGEISDRTDESRRQCLGNADVMLSLCSLLRRNRDLAPEVVFEHTRDIYQWVSRPDSELGLFDERDYFLGELALIAGGVCRQLGRREESFLWLDRSEAGFRHTLNPAPGLANVAYARLALRFEMGRYSDVLELSPSLEASFGKLRMGVEAAKCRLLLASTLKIVGEHSRAIELLEVLPDDPVLSDEPFLRARILGELGDLQQLRGEYSLASIAFQTALLQLEGRETSAAGADLKIYLGAAYRSLGSLAKARDAYRAGLREYESLGMRSLVAYSHLLVAEVLLEMKRDREGEWEILAALPAIDEMKMVPEGFAALALLRESVARRKTDRSALHQLRNQLQSNT